MKKIIVIIFLSINIFANVDSRIAKINSLLNEKKYIDALDSFLLSIEDYDASSELYFTGGQIYLKLDELDKANESFIKAIEFDPKNKDYRLKQKELEEFKQLLLSAKKTFDNGFIEDAIVEYDKMTVKYSSYAILFYNLGLVYKKNGDFELAATNYNIAKSLNPFQEKYIKAIKALAQVSAKEGDVEYRRQEFDAAIENYKKAIQYYPEYTTAIFKLARTYYKLKDLENSLETLKNGLLIDPNQEQSEKMLGDIYRKLDEKEKAIKHYKSAISINNNYFQAFYSLGSLYLSIGDLASAKEALLKSIEIEPTYAKAYGALGTVEQELNNVENSIKYFTEAIKYDKKAYDIYYRLATAYNSTKSHEMAKKHAKKSLEIKRNYAPAYFELGIAEKSLGNKIAAKDAFEKAKKDRNWRKSAQFELDMLSKGL